MRSFVIIIFGILFGGCFIGENKLNDIESISIIDKFNLNNEKIISFNFEIRFEKNGKVKLWRTNQISRLEFYEKIIPIKDDSLNLEFRFAAQNKKEIGLDSLRKIIDAQKKIREIEYQLYLDTVKSVFIKEIDPKIIEELIHVIKHPFLSKEDFWKLIKIKDKDEKSQKSIISELEENQNATFYPMIGITINFKDKKSIILYCDAQGNIAIPWKFKPNDKKNYNPKINWVLTKILPEELNINKHRLSKDMNDMNEKFDKILKE